eukprot:TRINITY_DN3561_c0_g2_i1.p1 TRINITY_DN3561_c0_g2~~TRINITY_DN3561_c0_g2_i1.p1  ORF type:complete len:898 (-),score=195.27 TRINITY_DN3561_c0_g2_i1:169-2862(-)
MFPSIQPRSPNTQHEEPISTAHEESTKGKTQPNAETNGHSQDRKSVVRIAESHETKHLAADSEVASTNARLVERSRAAQGSILESKEPKAIDQQSIENQSPPKRRIGPHSDLYLQASESQGISTPKMVESPKIKSSLRQRGPRSQSTNSVRSSDSALLGYMSGNGLHSSADGLLKSDSNHHVDSKSSSIPQVDRSHIFGLIKFNSAQVQFQVRVAEVVNMIDRKAAEDPPDLGILRHCLSILGEIYKHFGPLEGLLLRLHKYIAGCIFSDCRCDARCCADPHAPYFEHIQHLENEIDFMKEECQEADNRVLKKAEQMKALQEQIIKLKDTCSTKDVEIQRQRDKFDDEMEKDSSRTMSLYADVEVAEYECELHRQREVELLEMLSQVSQKVHEIELEKTKGDTEWNFEKRDFSDYRSRLLDMQTRIMDSVPKAVFKESQAELIHKREALSVLKSKYFSLHTSHKKLKASYAESLDQVHKLEQLLHNTRQELTPRPDFRAFSDLVGELDSSRSTTEKLTLLREKLISLQDDMLQDVIDITTPKTTNETKDSPHQSHLSKRRQTLDPFSQQSHRPESIVRKFFPNLGESLDVPVFLRSGFNAARSEYRPLGKHSLDTIIKEIYSKRLESLRQLYGASKGIVKDEKYIAGSRQLLGRTYFQDFFLEFLQGRYSGAYIEWGHNILAAAESHKTDPTCLVFLKTALGIICEDCYFELQGTLFRLQESLIRFEKKNSKKGIQVNDLTLEDILFAVQEAFPTKTEDDLQNIKQLLLTYYNGGHIGCDLLFGDYSGRQSLFLEILQDQYVLDMEEHLLQIEQSLENVASDYGVSPNQAAAVMQTIDPEAPIDIIKNAVAVGFQVSMAEMEALPSAPVDVRTFMKRIKQIIIHRYTVVDRHRKHGL